MSGQPYKYYTDVEKYKNEYLDALNLRASIDDMNLQANKTYKETGTMPAVSQMKDSRSTSEILADTEKLKIDIVDTLAKVSSQQFAMAVVQRIINSPLNQDNSLLIFTAQRANDLVEKLKRIYTYGIKGDPNDIQQIVNFIVNMYNDKNAIASSTKDFITKYGTNNLGQYSGSSQGSTMNNVKALLNELSIRLNTMFGNIEGLRRVNGIPTILINRYTETNANIRKVNNLIIALVDLIPNQEIVMYIDNQLNTLINNGVDLENSNNTDMKILVKYKEFINSGIPSIGNISLTERKLSKYYDIVIATSKTLIRPDRSINEASVQAMLANLNNFEISLDNLYQILQSSELFTYDSIIQLKNEFNRLHRVNMNQQSEEMNFTGNKAFSDLLEIGLTFAGLMFTFKIINLAIELGYAINNTWNDIQKEINELSKSKTGKPLTKLNKTEIQQLNQSLENGDIRQRLPKVIQDKITINPEDIEVVDKIRSEINLSSPQQIIAKPEDYEQIENISAELNLPLIGSVYTNKRIGGKWKLNSIKRVNGKPKYEFESIDNNDIINVTQTDFKKLFVPDNVVSDNQYIPPFSNAEELGYQIPDMPRIEYQIPPYLNYSNASLPYDLIGNGIRKRGRPKGSGIQKKYSDVVKQSISNDKGIQEDMRFVKFGKYLINNKKLNDGILAVKRPSGNNIIEFPSQRISGNMQNVIKTMIGGGIPKYEQLECLSEPEKAYLHKLSSKANIIDKFSIPAPSKTQYEKDIHDFEVMRGEIMSGNDNKDLIKKFKLHIMKLSKIGALPKREVSELLEELASLGY